MSGKIDCAWQTLLYIKQNTDKQTSSLCHSTKRHKNRRQSTEYTEYTEKDTKRRGERRDGECSERRGERRDGECSEGRGERRERKPPRGCVVVV
jgi:hypothetical protein